MKQYTYDNLDLIFNEMIEDVCCIKRMMFTSIKLKKIDEEKTLSNEKILVKI